MKIKIVEVGLRDGLQNESVILTTEQKLEILQGMQEAGMREIELTSFVHPKWIPQLADAENLMKKVAPCAGYGYRALVPNKKGFLRAQSFPLSEIAIFVSASQTHNRKNVNRSIEETLLEFTDWVPDAVQKGWKVRAYLSTSFGCPYEGEIPLSQVLTMIEKLFSLGVYEVSLGDTIGVATPNLVKKDLQEILRHFPVEQIAVHFHDTYGMAIANTYVALEAGITTVDSSIGGLGGCPYAPGAAGNLATEDLLYLLEKNGLSVGIDLTKCVNLSEKIEKMIRRPLTSRTYQALREKEYDK